MIQGGGMAAAPLEWSEIADWQCATGLILTTWEARTIRAMSIAYIGESRKAEDENCPPPWNHGVLPGERDSEESRLLAVLDAF